MQFVRHSVDIKFSPLCDMIKIYECASDLNFSKNINSVEISEFFKKYINNLNCLGFKNKECVSPKYVKCADFYKFEENNKIMIMFSGGKDSTALAMKYRNLGFDVVLYFLQGINISYRDEIDRAKEVASELGLPLIIDTIKVLGHGEFLENPTKNQLILSFAINKGLELGIYRYSYGGFTEDTVETSAFDRNFSDSIETFEWYKDCITAVFPQIEIITPFSNEIETLKIVGKHSKIWEMFQSCLSPYRYKEYLKTTNERKYNIKLLKNRCGSCWKCCMEYIVWCDLGLVDYNKDFYKHCLDIFAKKMPEEKPYIQKTKNKKDIYLAYIPSKKLLNKSKFFKEKD